MAKKKGVVISVANQKGGVAKTATTRILGDIYTEKGKKVLLIDFDHQSSLTKRLGMDPNLFIGINPHNICNIFDKVPISVVNIETGNNGVLHIIPCNDELKDGRIANLIGKEIILRNFIEKQNLREHYDVIIIDNTPAFGTMVINTILAADILVVPIEAARNAQDGAAGFFKSIEEPLQAYDHRFKKIVVIPTMIKNTNVSKFFHEAIINETIPYIKKKCHLLAESEIIVTSAIPESVVFESADGFNLSAYKYMINHKSETKKEKREVLVELLENIANEVIGVNNKNNKKNKG